MSTLQLHKPSVELVPAYLEMLAEAVAYPFDRGCGYMVRSDEIWERVHHDAEAFVSHFTCEEQGRVNALGFVPQTTYWLVKDGTTVIGESGLRHYLNSTLRIEGGHIGYYIRPTMRRLGYGTRILALTLEKARGRKLTRVLVTCNVDNIGSSRIIEHNGGLLAGTGISPRSGKQVAQYWIEL